MTATRTSTWPPDKSEMANQRWHCCGGRYADGHAKGCATERRRREHVETIAKGSTRAPAKRRVAPMAAVPRAQIEAPPTSTIEGSNQMSTTKTKTRPKATEPKATNGAALDTRALPYVIEWKSADGTCAGRSLTGDWGNARYRIKAYLDTCDATPQQVRDELTKALDAVKAGKSTSAGSVKITVTKR